MKTLIYKEFLDAEAGDIRDDRFLQNLGISNIIIWAQSNREYLSYFKHHECPFSIKYCFCGKEYYNMDGIQIFSSDENLVIVPPGKKYSSVIESDRPVESLMIFFSREFTEGFFSPSIFREEPLENIYEFLNPKKVIRISSRLLSRLQDVKYSLHSRNVDATDVLSRLILSLFETYGKIWENISSYNARKPATKKEISRRLFLVQDYIYSNYMQEVDLLHLGQISCLNHYYLIRKFKSFFGQTPYQMLLSRRMEVACKKVRTSGDSIADIADQVGYNSMPNFYQSFKDHYGMRPMEMRS